MTDCVPCRLLQHVESLRQLDQHNSVTLQQTVADSVPQWHAEPAAPLNFGMPVYVMLPLDTVWLTQKEGKATGMLKREQALEVGLKALERAGVEGVMIDVWWGLVEHEGPGQYDFAAYRRLFEKVRCGVGPGTGVSRSVHLTRLLCQPAAWALSTCYMHEGPVGCCQIATAKDCQTTRYIWASCPPKAMCMHRVAGFVLCLATDRTGASCRQDAVK